MKEELYYIQKTESYVGNCAVWWTPGGSGYTTHISQAGLFSKEDAQDICDHAHNAMMWRQEAVDEAATRQVDIQRLVKINKAEAA